MLNKIGLRYILDELPHLNEFVNPPLNFTHDEVLSCKVFSIPRIFVLNPQFISL